MTYNNARRISDYAQPPSPGVDEASKVIRDFVKDHQEFIIVEKWHEMFDWFEGEPKPMVAIAKYLESDPCPCCLGDNIKSHVLVVTCGDCGHSY